MLACRACETEAEAARTLEIRVIRGNEKHFFIRLLGSLGSTIPLFADEGIRCSEHITDQGRESRWPWDGLFAGRFLDVTRPFTIRTVPAFMNRPSDRMPLLAGLAAARANLVPGILIQMIMLALVAAYYYHEPTRHALDALAAWKREYGYRFTFVLLGLAGGTLPESCASPSSSTKGAPGQFPRHDVRICAVGLDGLLHGHFLSLPSRVVRHSGQFDDAHEESGGGHADLHAAVGNARRGVDARLEAEWFFTTCRQIFHGGVLSVHDFSHV